MPPYDGLAIQNLAIQHKIERDFQFFDKISLPESVTIHARPLPRRTAAFGIQLGPDFDLEGQNYHFQPNRR